MIEPKVGQVWIDPFGASQKISSVHNNFVRLYSHDYDDSPIGMDEFLSEYHYSKEETIKYLKEQQELINQQLEELSKPEIVKHKFEVIVHAPEGFDSNSIFNSLECTVYNYWTDGDITNYSVDVIKE